MLFIAKSADFSAKKIGTVNFVYDDSEGEDDVTHLIDRMEIRKEGVLFNSGQTFPIGYRLQLQGVAYPTNAYLRNDLEWSSSDTSKAIVSSTGMITFVSDGSVTITVMAKDGGYAKTSVTINVRNRTIEDKMAITDTVIGYYYPNGDCPYTNAQVIALDTLLARMGAGYSDSDTVWARTKYLMLPCLGNSVDNAATNAKNGYDVFTYNTSGATYKAAINYANGYLTAKDTSKAYIPISYAAKGNEFYVNNGYYMIHSGSMDVNGSTDTWARNRYILRSLNRTGIDTTSGSTYNGLLSNGNGILRGHTTNLTEDGTHLAPESLITSYTNDTLDGLFTKIDEAKWRLTALNIYLNSASYFTFAFAYGESLTAIELENLIANVNELLTAFGVDNKLN